MKKAKLATLLFTLILLFTFLPSLSFDDLGSTARRAEAAPASGILIVGQQCVSGDRVRMQFQWTASGEGPQWIDVSLSNNGFQPGTFAAVGPLAAGQNTLTWDGLPAGTTQYLRINTFTSSGWQASVTVSFTTIACAGFSGATGLVLVSQQCLGGNSIRINIVWSPSVQGPQWVDLSLQNNGFAPNTFIGIGGLPSNQGSFTWDGLLPNLPHYMRINTLTPGGWIASSTLAFTTQAGCANHAATNLRIVSQTCQADGRVTVAFAWNSSGQGIQWFDLSARNDNFSTPFWGFGPLSAGVSSLTLPHLEDGTAYYIRVNTFNGVSWAPAVAAFLTRNCADDFTTNDKVVDGTASGPDQAILDDVRIGAHPADGFDRIVFEFDGPMPDATIGYQASVSSCGSGNPVDVDGTGTLVIRMASTVAHNDMGMLTAPIQVDGTDEAILEARSTCDFEGVVVYAIGIDGVRGFRVLALSSPNRIVIDVIR